MITATLIFVVLYAFWLGGKLAKAEQHIAVIKAALERHLETGEDYRTDRGDA